VEDFPYLGIVEHDVRHHQRRDGFPESIEKFPDIETVIGPHTDFDRNNACDVLVTVKQTCQRRWE
jgi:ABC-type sugar transport system substrate-binding protein